MKYFTFDSLTRQLLEKSGYIVEERRGCEVATKKEHRTVLPRPLMLFMEDTHGFPRECGPKELTWDEILK